MTRPTDFGATRHYHWQAVVDGISVDAEMAGILREMWDAGIETLASCQGGPGDCDPDGGVYARRGTVYPYGYVLMVDESGAIFDRLAGTSDPDLHLDLRRGQRADGRATATVYFLPEDRGIVIDAVLLPLAENPPWA